jgi:biotin carboxyl carrier protein
MASLIALSESANSQHRILSPAVGMYYSFPEKGTFLVAGSSIGKMRVFNKIYDIFLPDDLLGEVVANSERDKTITVEYGQELFRLNPRERSEASKRKASESKPSETGRLDEGHVITAFTTGIFYRKSSPDAPPYVEEGQTIENGKVLGLIEVMKTFNHVIFTGMDSSDTGTIKKIFVKDAQEVKLNQPLFLIGK